MKINILLTFDYELPLGGCESYNKGLFEPAAKLIAKGNELNVPLVLFVDICSAMQFKEWDYSYYEKFKNQVHSALEMGHDVQLHIHPHWMDSEYIDGTVKPSKRFGLSDFKNHPTLTIKEIIETSIKELEDICKEVKPDYKCLAYRAGGYNVEPESKAILSTLHEKGIKYESSVIQGLYLNYSFNKIDYRNAPSSNYWKVPINGPLTETTEKEPFLIEYPISSMPNSLFNVLKRRIHKILHKKEIASKRYDNSGKGYSAISQKTSFSQKMRIMMNPVVLTFDRDYMELHHLEKVVNHVIKRNLEKEEIFITLISHPKSMGKHHLDLMEQFVSQLKNQYSSDINFTSYNKINQEC